MSRFRDFAVLVVVAGGCMATAEKGLAAGPSRFNIAEHSAIGDGKTLNTTAIQAAIDQCAATGGGTLVVPNGEFVTGALFLKPGVNLELNEGIRAESFNEY